jgi:hypothetical protein
MKTKPVRHTQQWYDHQSVLKRWKSAEEFEKYFQRELQYQPHSEDVRKLWDSYQTTLALMKRVYLDEEDRDPVEKLRKDLL